MPAELPHIGPYPSSRDLGRRVCDFHQHIGFSSRWTINPPAEVVAKLRAAGFCGAVVWSFEAACGEGYSEANDKVLESAKLFPELVPFCRVDLNDLQESLDEFHRAIDAGALGLKLHPLSDNIDPYADDVGRFLAEVSKKKIPLIIHSNKDPGSEPLMWEHHIKEHPEQTFILGHAGFFKWRDSMSLARRYDNVYLEASLCPRLPSEQIAEFVRPDRILFGSDMPYGDDVGSYYTMLSAIERAYSGEAAEEVKEQVFIGNAERVLGYRFPEYQAIDFEIPGRPVFHGTLHAKDQSIPCRVYDLLDRDASVCIDAPTFDPMDAERLVVEVEGQSFSLAVHVVCGHAHRFACEFEEIPRELLPLLNEGRALYFEAPAKK